MKARVTLISALLLTATASGAFAQAAPADPHHPPASAAAQPAQAPAQLELAPAILTNTPGPAGAPTAAGMQGGQGPLGGTPQASMSMMHAMPMNMMSMMGMMQAMPMHMMNMMGMMNNICAMNMMQAMPMNMMAMMEMMQSMQANMLDMMNIMMGAPGQMQNGQQMPGQPMPGGQQMQGGQAGQMPVAPGMGQDGAMGGAAVAPGAMGGAIPGMALTEAGQGYMNAMNAMQAPMVEAMQIADPDVAFVLGMIAHHQAAIDMSRTLLEFGGDERTRQWAEAIIAAQQQEIDDMRAWLAERGL
ncbi:MAG: DUF305 domain-containing protein [Geminicoccaceae bacterium]